MWIIETDNLRKEFKNIVAVNNVNFKVKEGDSSYSDTKTFGMPVENSSAQTVLPFQLGNKYFIIILIGLIILISLALKMKKKKRGR